MCPAGAYPMTNKLKPASDLSVLQSGQLLELMSVALLRNLCAGDFRFDRESPRVVYTRRQLEKPRPLRLI
jgi:hypothetical protein